MKFLHIVSFSLALAFGSPMLSSAQNNTGFFLHTVEKGQSLYSIANMYSVSIEDIVQLNPQCNEQIRAGQALKIPQTAATGSNSKRFHTIQAGETLYKLTVKYNITAQEICDANPGLSASNFRIGQVIVIPNANSAELASTAAAQTPAPQTDSSKKSWKDMHKVEKKETIFSISRMYGITEDELIAANPELRKGKLKKGTFLFIPYPKESAQKSSQSPSNEQLFQENAQPSKNIQTVKVAVLLPFGGNDQQRMTEFYEGFLIAVDSLKKKGESFDIYTYDTSAGVNTILAKSEMKDMDIIFGPAHTSNISAVAGFAEKNNIRLVIPFAPKVDQVFNSPNIYQVNTPQSYLYSEVYEHFIRKFGKTNVIFMDDGTSDKSKSEFIKGMKSELKDNSIKYKQIRLTNEVTPETVIAAMDTLSENIFIPLSGERTTLTKLLPNLTMVRREHPNFNMQLFGYPEWQTYTQDFLANFYELDTYFYSSFYTNNLFPAAINFTRDYRRWYSKDMANSYPKYGMLGFDIGYFFLRGLSQWGNKLEDNLNKGGVTAIQTGFKFERVNNWGGFINRKVFFVHFSKNYELIKLDFE